MIRENDSSSNQYCISISDRTTNSIDAEELDTGVECYRLLRAYDVSMFRG